MDNKIIANSIKSLRKKNGVSQEKLAEYLGVSFQAVSKYAFLGMALFLIISLTSSRRNHLERDSLQIF